MHILVNTPHDGALGWCTSLPHPEVVWVHLADDMTSATVYFRIIYEGGESTLVKKDGKWRITSSEINGIE